MSVSTFAIGYRVPVESGPGHVLRRTGAPPRNLKVEGYELWDEILGTPDGYNLMDEATADQMTFKHGIE